jgi:uncharacterized membrane protein YccC
MERRFHIVRRTGSAVNGPLTPLRRLRNFLVGLMVALLAGAFLIAAFLLGSVIFAIAGIAIAAAVAGFIVRSSLPFKNR